ncbi:Fungal lipase-like domain, partial [Dillenia turbinata]
FESSEMLATFLASTPLLRDSWRLCDIANRSAPGSYVMNCAGDIGYVAFSGIQTVVRTDPIRRNLVPLDTAGEGIFSALHCGSASCGAQEEEAEEPAMVHAGMLRLFKTTYDCPGFRKQMMALMETSKSLVITGHSLGGILASLSTLWLLSYLQSIYSSLSIICITFGSPLLGNHSLNQAILRQRWGGKFCHVVSKDDIMPRILFAPVLPFIPQLNIILQSWQWSMTSRNLSNFTVQLSDKDKAELFRYVSAHVEEAASLNTNASLRSQYRPFGSYLFFSSDGAICVDSSAAVVQMLSLMFSKASPNSCIENHLKYGDCVNRAYSSQFLNKGTLEVSEASYEASLKMALRSSGLNSSDSEVEKAKDCLRMAKQLGRTPSLNCAKLAINLSKITRYRAQIEWYQTYCDESDDQMGYYDSFKQKRASKREVQVNKNRIKLAAFWDNVITMLDNNQLPCDFDKRAKWVNASQFYKLLVEPLDIAEYYRSGTHLRKGHYMKYGRERRFEIFDRWWRERSVGEEENGKRSKYAGLTQDTCFWARVEEAREWLDKARMETDKSKLDTLLENINYFEAYASQLVERKEVSKDVLAKYSSYSIWMDEWKEYKSQVPRISPQLLSCAGRETVL